MSNVLKRILFEKRPFARLAFFSLADGLLIVLSVILAFVVRFESFVPERYFLNVQGIMVLSLIITISIFYLFKLYNFTWSYVSAEEMIALVKAVFLSFLILTATFFVLRDQVVFSGFPRSTLFITYFFIFVFCGGLRFAKRAFLQIFPAKDKKDKEKTLIVGAGEAGEKILRSISIFPASPFLPIGFIDDSPAKQGSMMHGLKIFGTIEDIPKVVKENKIEGLVIAMPSADSQTIQLAVEKGREAGLRKIRIVPPIEELISGKVSIGQLRDVEINDLLDREIVIVGQKSIENFIKDKIVLVTGAAGSIGSELCRQTARFKPKSLIALDQDETGIFNISEDLEDSFPKLDKHSLIADIRDEQKISRIFQELQPDIVFHAAAYKHVPLMEESPDEAVKNNVFGTKILAEIAIKNKVKKFIFISTDKAVNPTSVMGATKRLGEIICQDFNQKNSTKFISVRFGNVLGSRGSIIPIFREKIKKREPIEVTHPDMTRFFMTTPEACLLVMRAGEMGQGGEVFVLDMGDSVKIVDLAKKMIQLSGLKPDIDIPIVFTKPRPGEKIFEELLTAEEGISSTESQKIFTARLSTINKEKIDSELIDLKKAAETGNNQVVISALKEMTGYGEQK